MATVWTLNGQNLRTDYGFVPRRIERRRFGPSRKTTLFEIPNRAGAFLGTTRWGPSRRQVVGTMVAASMTPRETAEDKLRALLESGLLTLQVDHGDGFPREFDAVLEGEPQFSPFDPEFNAGIGRASRVSFELLTSSPYWYAAQMRVLSFGATRKAVQLGTAVSDGILEVMGSATNPTLNYRGANGEVLKSMAFTVTLGATAFLRLDLGAQTIVTMTAGVQAAGPAFVGSWITLDPQDGNYETAAWPTLDVTAGSAVLFYREAYL